MKTIRVLALASLAALCAPGASAAPGLMLSEPVVALVAVATAQWSLGLVVDGRRSGDAGVTVLAVSPGGAADRMGVLPGDRLVAINGQSLAGVQATNALLGRALAAADGAVRLELVRDGSPLTLDGRALEARTGQVAGCGYVSAVGVPPRVSRNIFEAEITQINGESTSLEAQNRYRVAAGRHVVVVREHIDRHRLSSADRQRIQRMQRRQVTGAYKALVVDVDPGMRYSIGAELLPDQMSPEQIRANAWWQPVVWEARPEACR